MFQMNFLKNESPGKIILASTGITVCSSGSKDEHGKCHPLSQLKAAYCRCYLFSHHAVRKMLFACIPNTIPLPAAPKLFFWELPAMHTCLWSPQGSLNLPSTSASRKGKKKILLHWSPFRYRWKNIPSLFKSEDSFLSFWPTHLFVSDT